MSNGVYKKINNILKEIESIEKTANIKIGGGGYKAVEHDEVTRLLHMPIANAGLIVVPNELGCHINPVVLKGKHGDRNEFKAQVTMNLKVIDIEDGSSIETCATAYAFDSGDKATGKAQSMAIKYCYLKLFMLESKDNEEARVEGGTTHQKRPTPISNEPEDYTLNLLSKYVKGKKISDVEDHFLQQQVDYWSDKNVKPNTPLATEINFVKNYLEIKKSFNQGA